MRLFIVSATKIPQRLLIDIAVYLLKPVVATGNMDKVRKILTKSTKKDLEGESDGK